MTRKVTIPGETIASGEDYLPGEGTEKRGNDIVAVKYGLIDSVLDKRPQTPMAGSPGT